MGSSRRNKYNSRSLGYLALIFGLLCLGASCERIYEEPTDNVDDAVDFAVALHTPISLIEIIEHSSSKLLSAGLFQVNADSLGLEIGAQVQLLDSSFTDDDSIVFEIVFGGNQTNAFDRKKRSGRIEVIFYVDYTEAGSTHLVRIDDKQPYTLTLNNGDLHTLTGNLSMERLITDGYEYNLTNLNLETKDKEGLKDYKCNSIITANHILGVQIPGILGDLVSFTGKGNWSLDKVIWDWEILLPLQMRYEFGCTDYVHKGITRLIKTSDRYTIDFDPFQTGACNRIVKIIKGGNEFEVTLP
jgi:hypothetical protein